MKIYFSLLEVISRLAGNSRAILSNNVNSGYSCHRKTKIKVKERLWSILYLTNYNKKKVSLIILD